MVYILKNLNLRKFCISFMICFIFIIIGITHVFADEKPTITQVVMDKHPRCGAVLQLADKKQTADCRRNVDRP